MSDWFHQPTLSNSDWQSLYEGDFDLDKFNEWLLNHGYESFYRDYGSKYFGDQSSGDFLADWKRSTGKDFGRGDSDPLERQYLAEMYKMYLNQEKENLNTSLRDGSISAREYQGRTSGLGVNLSPEESSYMNNMLSTQATAEQNAENRDLRDTSITSAANQYESLGLNPASVIYSGGANAGGVAQADLSQQNVSMDKKQMSQQLQMNKFNQMAQTARTLLGVTGSMASAGIYGGSLAAAKKAASAAASSMAHSAESTIKYNFDSNGQPLGHQIIDRQWK